MPILFGYEIGAEEITAAQKFSIYLPNKDNKNNLIENMDEWIAIGMALMAKINTGATKLPPAKGIWKNSDGSVLLEDTTIIYSYLLKPDQFSRNKNLIREFLHKFGRETNQDCVVAELTGEDPEEEKFYSRMYEIRTFDLAPSGVADDIL